MKTLLKTAFLFVIAIASAKAALPVGTFGHEFTKVKGQPVWSIQTVAVGYKLFRYGDGKKESAHLFTPLERKTFWSKMGWSLDTQQDSECIGAATELICHVPLKSRQSIPDLQSNSSGFFHYDEIGGIMKIQLLVEKAR